MDSLEEQGLRAWELAQAVLYVNKVQAGGLISRTHQRLQHEGLLRTSDAASVLQQLGGQSPVFAQYDSSDEVHRWLDATVSTIASGVNPLLRSRR